MLGLSFGEIMVVAMIALMVVGPDNLPKFARSAGRYYAQLRRMADDLRRGLVLEADRQDAEDRLEALRKRREEAEAQRRAAEQASPGVQSQPDALPGAPEPAADDEELSDLLTADDGPYASGRSLDDVTASWRDAPRQAGAVEDEAQADRSSPRTAPPRATAPSGGRPAGVSEAEWAELPQHIRALLIERDRGAS